MAPEAEMQPYHAPKKSWTELYSHVKLWRLKLREAFGQSSCGSFQFRTGQDGGKLRTRIYGLGPLNPDRDHTMMYVDIPSETGNSDEGLLFWQSLLEESEATNDRHIMSKEEELLRERMRCTISGITSFDSLSDSGTLLFAAGLGLFMCNDKDWSGKVIAEPMMLAGETGAPLDPKMCPGDPNLVVYVSKNDIYFQYQATSRRGTYAGNNPDCFSGTPSFIIQEEFDRYSAIWWNPATSGSSRHYLLYEETDESDVVELSINTPAARLSSVDHMKYPLAGTQNAQSTLKLLEIDVVSGSHEPELEIREKQLQGSLGSLFPWMEYLCRAGWTPDGNGVWAQIMSRKQDRTALVFIPVDYFTEMQGSMQDLTKSVDARVTVLYEEINTIWINYHDCLTFLPSECKINKELAYIWWSEKTGYGHFYLIRAGLSSAEEASHEAGPRGPFIVEETVLTSGDWPVLRKIAPVVDEERGLVFFMALKDTPLETHLYVTSYRNPGSIKRLTPMSQCHFANRWEKTLSLDLKSGLFVDWMSSVTVEPKCAIFKLHYTKEGELPDAFHAYTLRLPSMPSPEFVVMETNQNDGAESSNRASAEEMASAIMDSAKATTDEENVMPEIISYTSANTGYVHYATLYRPVGWKKGVKYPVLLYVYGGPEVQLVRNVWSSWNGFQKYVSLGYAVVMIDGRGSAMRGLKFEGMIKHRMGTVEIDDQVEGLDIVAQKTDGLVDLQRVAIFGWSYGGYLALQALVQRPDVFKVGIAGGPVTTWYLYDTGYTERYMGLPQEEGEAYKTGSVLARVSHFPDEPGRLIILHGVIDENVHFQHTAKLIDALIRAGKPYQLQIFPKERHGVRGNEANEHMDVTILNHLQTYL